MAQIGENHDGIEGYLKYLQGKYPLSDEHLVLIGQKWLRKETVMFEALMAGEYSLRVFEGDADGTCFQIYDGNLAEVLKSPIPAEVCTSNGLIISKYYFVLQILRLFRHLHSITQILTLEKCGLPYDQPTDLMEVDTMDSFLAAASELFNK